VPLYLETLLETEGWITEKVKSLSKRKAAKVLEEMAHRLANLLKPSGNFTYHQVQH
jgi:hypothetical protein